jgi:hypothetical protein
MLYRHKNLTGVMVVIAFSVGTTGAALATQVTTTFAGDVTGVSSTNYAGPYSYNIGDTITGTISYDDGGVGDTFTATLTDVNTDTTFTLPSTDAGSAGYVDVVSNSDSVTGSPPTYTVTANDSLEYSGYTPFTADLLMSVVNGIGNGSLSIDVAAEPISHYNATGNSEETLAITFDVPEPASIGILGLGFAGLMRVRRRASR